MGKCYEKQLAHFWTFFLIIAFMFYSYHNEGNISMVEIFLLVIFWSIYFLQTKCNFHFDVKKSIVFDFIPLVRIYYMNKTMHFHKITAHIFVHNKVNHLSKWRYMVYCAKLYLQYVYSVINTCELSLKVAYYFNMIFNLLEITLIDINSIKR